MLGNDSRYRRPRRGVAAIVVRDHEDFRNLPRRLSCHTNSSIGTAQSSVEARARAVKMYPDLAKADPLINRQFHERYETYQRTSPEFFDNPEWPKKLARECALGITFH